MWGVGKKNEPLLLQKGIRTIGDLAGLSRKQAADLLGKHGLHFWELAHGIDPREVVPHEQAKSVSQERTFFEDTDDGEQLQNTLFYLCNEVSRLMRKSNQKGRTVTLKIRFSDFSTFTRAHTHTEFLQCSEDIYRVILRLFNSFQMNRRKVRLLGVAVSNLSTIYGEQLSMLQSTDSKSARLDRVMDEIERKFGKQAIKKASIMNRRSYLTPRSKDRSGTTPPTDNPEEPSR